MIELSYVSKRYPGGYDALRAVSFKVAPGELVFLTGHSGAGKSTLLRLLTRIERPTRGQLIVNRKNLERLPRWRIPYYRRELGVVFQDNKLLPERTVFDNVALPLVAAGVARHEIPKRVRAALDLVGLLPKERLRPLVLSGGEQQRVGIARAVVNRPALLLADEPTGNLDWQLSETIFDLFRAFHHHGTTVLIATHDLRQVPRLKPRVLTLQAGELVADSGAAAMARPAL
jgi:cell division transport system ATP-binding protein